MDFGKIHIDTIDSAKAYFQAMGCSYFHMIREFPERFEEYKNLEVPKETERRWTVESLTELNTHLIDPTTNPRDLWWKHSQMETLVQLLNSEDALQQIYHATEAIVDRLPNDTMVIVAETINGTANINYRSGLIFLANTLNRNDIARCLAEISLTLSNSAKQHSTEPDRCDSAITTCKEIKSQLGLT